MHTSDTHSTSALRASCSSMALATSPVSLTVTSPNRDGGRFVDDSLNVVPRIRNPVTSPVPDECVHVTMANSERSSLS